MTFPGGTVSLPTTLLNPGKSGSKQVHAPEQSTGFARMSDAALERLAENLLRLMDEVAAEEKRGGLSPSLREYVELLDMQVSSELLRRAF